MENNKKKKMKEQKHSYILLKWDQNIHGIFNYLMLENIYIYSKTKSAIKGQIILH